MNGQPRAEIERHLARPGEPAEDVVLPGDPVGRRASAAIRRSPRMTVEQRCEVFALAVWPLESSARRPST